MTASERLHRQYRRHPGSVFVREVEPQGEPEHCDRCGCGQDQYVVSRLDIWKTAAESLKNAGLNEPPSGADVLYLAQFLAGDDVLNSTVVVEDDG